MLVEFAWLQVKGCSFRVAARHVWYDRFEKEEEDDMSVGGGEDGHVDSPDAIARRYVSEAELVELQSAKDTTLGDSTQVECSTTYPGSGIDRAWRYTMVSFIFGALPQAIKVFGMRGIPLTQVLVSFLVVSFIVPEIFRMISGPAGAVDLRPMPIISETKRRFAEAHNAGLWAACGIGWGFSYFCLINLVFMRPYSEEDVWRKAAVVFVIAPPLAVLITIGITAATYVLWILLVEFTWGSKRNWIVERMTPRLKSRVVDLYALESDIPGAGILFIAVFPPIVAMSILCLVFANLEPEYDMHNDDGTSALVFFFLLSIFSIPLLLSASHIVFRLVFMGSISETPRKLSGIIGLTSEFVSGSFVMVNLFCAVVGYAYCDPFYVNTYKPDWAEWLG
jgi:uncharacterized membrane protein YqaE (UPF0057 family)